MVPQFSEVYTSFDEEYQALRNEIVIFNRSDVGFLFLSGKDSLDFLNRLSTNDMVNLREDAFRSTILTTEKGRIIDFVTVIPYDDGYMLEISPNNEGRILSWLEKFIVMEDLKISVLTSNFAKVSVTGSKVSPLVQHLGVSTINGPKENVYRINFVKKEIMVCRDSLFPSSAWNIYCYRKDLTTLLHELTSASFLGSKVQEAGKEVFETFRIEEGVPVTGKELTEKVSPLEAGLKHFVSFTKGCYIGQEVIARVDSYDKLQRRLKGFACAATIEGEGMIFQNGTMVGWTTSHCHSPILNQYLALGYLKTDITKEKLLLRLTSGVEYPIKLVELPIHPI